MTTRRWFCSAILCICRPLCDTPSVDLTLTTLQVESFLKDQWNILVDLNISIINLLRLKQDIYDFENQIKRHGFFQHHWYQLKFIGIIQLSKLFSSRKNVKRSFYKLCTLLDSVPFHSSFTSHLSHNRDRSIKIATSREGLLPIILSTRSALAENDTLIEKILNVRDKVYAHNDPNTEVRLITSDEMKVMVGLANKIYNNFSFNIFFKTTLFEESKSWEIDYVLWHMSEMRKKDMEELEKKKMQWE